jgi:hypothetical protein
MRRGRWPFLLAVTGFATACAGGRPPVVQLPEAAPGVRSIFSNGQPIALVEAPEARLLLALDPTRLGTRQYARLWLLYQNTSRDTLLFDPARCATVEVVDTARGGSDRLEPEAPSRVLARISNEQAAATIAEAIGGALQVASAESRIEARLASEQASDALDRTAGWYDLFRASISAGVLRRNTLFPGQAVQGYVYFALPERTQDSAWGTTGVSYVGSRRFEHEVRLNLPSGGRAVRFRPADGE